MYWDKIIDKYIIEDKNISELENNGTTSIFLKRNGKRIEVPNLFPNLEIYKESIKELVEMFNENSNEGNFKFLEEGTIYLKDGGLARCHIVFPPVSLYPLVTIARKSPSLTTLEDIRAQETFNARMYDFLKMCIDCNVNMIISGGTGSGKTTLLEALTKNWDNRYRIGVIEDAPELILKQPNVIYMKSSIAKPGETEKDIATLSWCVAQFNRMRGDKLIIGETRGAELSAFLTAANSGCEGSITTIHANTPEMCLQKMNYFINQALNAPQRAINQNIASTIDIIIQLNKNIEGKHKITHISYVSKILSRDEKATITISDIFTYNEEEDTWYNHTIEDSFRRKIERHKYNYRTFTKEEETFEF